jgi:ubiquinone/menaquinone biosynthesis C-methylase UbiE
MAFYLDRYAELYDLFYRDKPYRDEAAFVAACLQERGVAPGSRLIELACGTGRHAQELAAAGYRVTATDISPDMLAVAQRRPNSGRAPLEFVEADMRTVPLGDATFDGAVSFFDSIGYLQTNDAIVETFRNTRRLLRPNGVMMFEFWHAAAMLRSFDPTRVRRWRIDGSEIVRISETSLDVERQVAHVAYEIIERDAAGAVRSSRETHTNRYFLVQEMAALAALGGLTPLAWYAGFSTTGPITADTWHVIGIVQRRDP